MADKYANIMFEKATESSANTLTFKKIEIGMSLFDKVAILIHRIEWYNYAGYLIAADDALSWGLSTSNSWTIVSSDQPSIITFRSLLLRDFGTAGNNWVIPTPLIDDFSTLPGGGLLTTPKPLFLFVSGTALASPGVVEMRMFFTIQKLSDSDFFELLETRAFFG